MASTFFGLHIAYSGLNAFNASINTTANNVSNVETEGYSRQTVELQSSSALRVYQKYGSVGTGVKAEKVTQMRDEYYDQKYWYTNPSLGFYDRKVYYMNQIEDYYTDNVANPGFSTILSKMFNSLDSIKDNAGDTSVRNEFISDAEKLCNYFNHTASSLQELQSTINDEIKTVVQQINSVAQKIALLNKQINTIEQQNGQANELRDQRALLVDELSKIATVDVEENEVVNSNDPDMYTGATTFTVKLNGQRLVDTYEYKQLAVKTREAKHNQCDVDGLYDLVWEDSGNVFNVQSKTLNGSLKALFEMRDGNDEQNIRGVVDGETLTGQKIKVGGLNITDIREFNLPDNGMLMVNNYEIPYRSFEVETDANGTIVSVTFDLQRPITSATQEDIANQKLSVGTTINYKGIPYYQNQMNNFLRSFSQAFNDVHQKGEDLNGDKGASFFVADKAINLKEEGDFDVDYRTLVEKARTEYIAAGHTEAEALDAIKTATFTNADDTILRLTALNTAVSEVFDDPKKFAATKNINNGIDNYDNILGLLDLESKTILYRGNAADKFLQCIYADITVDAQECETFKSNYTSIMDAIQAQRDSVSSVDEDEEAMDLVKFQNAYNLASKVIQTMTEMYDQLILNTGV